MRHTGNLGSRSGFRTLTATRALGPTLATWRPPRNSPPDSTNVRRPMTSRPCTADSRRRWPTSYGWAPCATSSTWAPAPASCCGRCPPGPWRLAGVDLSAGHDRRRAGRAPRRAPRGRGRHPPRRSRRLVRRRSRARPCCTSCPIRRRTRCASGAGCCDRADASWSRASRTTVRRGTARAERERPSTRTRRSARPTRSNASATASGLIVDRIAEWQHGWTPTARPSTAASSRSSCPPSPEPRSSSQASRAAHHSRRRSAAASGPIGPSSSRTSSR